MEFINLTPKVWIEIVAVVLGTLAFCYLATPLLTMLMLRFEAKPQIVPFDSEEKPPPREIVKYYEKHDQELKDAGFEQLTGVLMPAPVPNVRVILWLYVHRANRDTAMITALWGTATGAGSLRTRYVEIISNYEDGPWEEIATSNNGEVGGFPDPPPPHISRMPQVKQADLLYRYHQMIVRSEGLESGKVLSVLDHYDGDVTRYLQEAVLGEEFERQAKNGYLRLNQARKIYKPTFFGAYPMTWRQLFPIKQIIQAGYNSNGRKLEEKLNASA